MKRIQLLEIGILSVAFIMGYKAFEDLTISAITMIYSYKEILGSFDTASYIFRYLLFFILYGIIFLILIKNSWKIALYINNQSKYPETTVINLDKKEILHIVIIAIAFLTILNNITTVIIYIFNYFKLSVGRTPELLDDLVTGKPVADFKSSAVIIVLSILVLYFSDSITNFLLKRKTTGELIIETPPQNVTD